MDNFLFDFRVWRIEHRVRRHVNLGLVSSRSKATEDMLAQRQLKQAGIEAELKQQEFGSYAATSALGKYEGMAMGPFAIAFDPHVQLYSTYIPGQPRKVGHVNDGRMNGMLKEQMRIKDVETRRRLVFDIQRYAAEQQYYVYLYSVGTTASWQPYVKNYAPTPSFDYGNRAAALWLDRA
jgi:ABC-type transport system substrate-binding protein